MHLNWVIVVVLPGRMLRWLLLPRTRSNEMLVKRVLLAPCGLWQRLLVSVWKVRQPPPSVLQE